LSRIFPKQTKSAHVQAVYGCLFLRTAVLLLVEGSPEGEFFGNSTVLNTVSFIVDFPVLFW